MKKLLLLLTIALMSMSARATIVGGINYTLSGSTAKVERLGGGDLYNGDIVIPETVSYGGSAYTVTEIGMSAFDGSSITSIEVPATCTTIGMYALSNSTSLTTIILNCTACDIKGNAFNGDTSLRDIYVASATPYGVAGATFNGIDKTKINIHCPSAAAVSTYYSSWSGFRTYLVPGSIQAGELYYNLKADGTAMVMAPYTIAGTGAPKQISGTVTIPSTVEYKGTVYPVTDLEAGVFYETPGVTKVVFEEGVKNIQYETFYMTNITEQTLPNSLETLEETNFYYCTKLTSVTLGTGIRTIGNNFLLNSANVTDLTVLATTPPSLGTNSAPQRANITLHVPAGSLTAYQAQTAWQGFKAYVEVASTPDPGIELPVDVTVGELSYTLNADMTATVIAPLAGTPAYTGKVVIPETVSYEEQSFTVTNIAKNAFAGSTGLTTLTIGGAVQEIAALAFTGCTALRDIYVTSATPCYIYGATFTAEQKAQINVHCPSAAAVTAYGNDSTWKTFRAILGPDCVQVGELYYNLKADGTAMVMAPYIIAGSGAPKQISGTITIPSTIAVEDKTYPVTDLEAGVFYQTPGVTEVIFEEGVKNIQYETFWNTNVTEQVLPNSLETLEEGNFFSCHKLTSLTMGTGIKTIGGDFLKNSEKMADLTMLATTPPTLGTGSAPQRSQITLHVPYGSKAAYEAQTAWQGFKAVVELPVTPTGIAISPAMVTGRVDDTRQLTATLSPAGATGEPVWTSSDETIATVDATGLVTLRSAGTATITATLGSLSATATVTVKEFDGYIFYQGIYYRLTERAYPAEENTLQATVVSPTDYEPTTTDEYTGDIAVPGFIEYKGQRYAVTELGSNCFNTQTGITSVTLPETLRTIGNNVFGRLTITSLTIPAGVTSVGNNFLFRCTSLAELTVKATVPPTATSSSMNNAPTATCRLLVPNGYEADYKAVTGWKEFTTVETDPDSPVPPVSITLSPASPICALGETISFVATVLPDNATDRTVEWKSLNPEVGTIDADGLFTPKTTGHANIEAICNGRRTLSAMVSVMVLDSIAEVNGIYYRLLPQGGTNTATVVRGSQPYTGTLEIPALITYSGVRFTVNAITDNAFANMKDLRSVTIPVSVQRLGRYAFYGSGIDVIDLPASIRDIPDYAFADCADLVSVGLPDNLRSIGTHAFENCGRLTFLRSLCTGNNITPPAFSTFAGDDTGYGAVFSPDIFPTCYLLIRSSMYKNYKQAAGWKNFRNFVYIHDGEQWPDFSMTAEKTLVHTDTPFKVVAAWTPADSGLKIARIFASDSDAVSITPASDGTSSWYDVTASAQGEYTLTAYSFLRKASVTFTVDDAAGIDTVGTETTEGEVRWFNIQGIELAAPEPGQVVIEVRDGKATRKLYR